MELNPALVNRLLEELELRTRNKIETGQGGTATFFDSLILKATSREVDFLEHIGPFEKLLRYCSLPPRGRLTDYCQRVTETEAWAACPWEPTGWQLSASQGIGRCFEWRGLPLFKSVYDFALFPMLLWNVKPGTIFEFGSGAGGSALWLADTLRAFSH
jgi:hypothetical protein